MRNDSFSLYPADKSYQLLACNYLQKQLVSLNKQINGVRENKDIEYVHQARVASRRIREALSIFEECFEKSTVKKWEKYIRRLTKKLGSARDTDVQIEAMEQELENIGEKKKNYITGIRRLLLRLKQQRARKQPKVIISLSNIQSNGILRDMKNKTTVLLFDLSKQNIREKSPYVLDKLGEHISNKIQRLMAFETSLINKNDHENQHRMRIAAKKLRYSLEISRPVFDKDIELYIDKIKTIQTMLGGRHDSHVWIEYLKEFRREEKEFTREFYGKEKPFEKVCIGIDYLKRKNQRNHTRMYKEVTEYWKNLKDTAVFESLIQYIRNEKDRLDGFGGQNNGGQSLQNSVNE
jgi:CHAD domain-containing protein